MRLHGLALCAGIGGLELGIKLACPRFRTVCYVEGEAYAASVLAARMGDKTLDQAPIWDDVRSFDGHPWRGLVDIVTAGYPCQPFSVAGKGLGEKDPRHLWPDIARIIAEVRPARVFCENVAAHLSKGFGTVARDMEEMDYTVAAGVFTAWAVGAPHQRERLFWLATNTDSTELWDQQGRRGWAGRQNEVISRGYGSAECLADTDRSRQLQPGKGERAQWRRAGNTSWWAAEPNMGRVANGTPRRVDRLRALGNGVVPEMARRAFLTLMGELA